MIHVAIIEDDHDIREALQLIIDSTDGFICELAFEDCERGLPAILDYRPDVVLMDINLPGMSGIGGTWELQQKFPELNVIMLTIQSDNQSVFESLQAGASGYMLKNTPPEALLRAIEEVNQGGAPMSMQIARKVLQSFHRSAPSPLSKRETEILGHLCKGLAYKAVAEKLFVSGHTVRSHIKNIYQKLQVNSRAEMVEKALHNNWVTLEN